jgi:hypothetical protein
MHEVKKEYVVELDKLEILNLLEWAIDKKVKFEYQSAKAIYDPKVFASTTYHQGGEDFGSGGGIVEALEDLRIRYDTEMTRIYKSIGTEGECIYAK